MLLFTRSFLGRSAMSTEERINLNFSVPLGKTPLQDLRCFIKSMEIIQYHANALLSDTRGLKGDARRRKMIPGARGLHLTGQ